MRVWARILLIAAACCQANATVAAEPPVLLPVQPQLLQELDRLRQPPLRDNPELAADLALRLTFREGGALVAHPTEAGSFWPVRNTLRLLIAEEKPSWQPRYEAALSLRHAVRLKRAGSDVASLFQIVDESGGELSGGRALIRLGDALLAEHRAWEAEHYYEAALTKGPRSDVGALRGRLVLSALHQGNGTLTTTRYHQFLAEHGEAEGELAGERGLLKTRLQTLAREHAATFVSARWLGDPRSALQLVRLIERPELRWAKRRVGDWLVTTQRGVQGISLLDGQPRIWLPATEGKSSVADANGFTVIQLADQNTLSCFDLRGDGKLLWRQQPRQADSGFVGDPVLTKDRAFVLVNRTDGPDVITSLASYDLSNGTEAWQLPLWRHSGRGVAPAHLELVASGRAIVAVSTAGVAVALDKNTGQPLWGKNWQTRSMGIHAEPDAMTRRLLAVQRWLCRIEPNQGLVATWDVMTGRTVWELPIRGSVRWLGTIQSLAILETQEGLLALDVATGNAIWSYPPTGKLAGQGRGACYEGKVWWPTDNGWHVLDGMTGRLLVDPIELDHLPLGDLYPDQDGLWVRRADRAWRFGPAVTKEPS